LELADILEQTTGPFPTDLEKIHIHVTHFLDLLLLDLPDIKAIAKENTTVLRKFQFIIQNKLLMFSGLVLLTK
jgi:hypothetical protein